ncbi:spermidine/putrescine transport system permease protein [Palleronia marisminoris]|uniref:Spermidine/putrescine transport system permease protein PotB n=1 Tax=Palleronia marisminoris TaxID=315423 RepID=A0A1Y5RN28_9RHOB|nr:ABC transporter permease [Palleronia marisminoris]SFG28147.1 spermidine/putrescine transport system permease protein [Palleronia marisminoris]SLN20956.1 Spermidine/putrescine transport system permease protein PotB [Palleronia marisminoris]
MREFRIWGLLPAQILMVATLIVPVLIIVAVSFATRGPYGGFDFVPTTAAYRQILFTEGWSGEVEFNPQYLIIIARTVLLATLTTLICMVLAFPVAYWITLQKRTARTILLVAVTLPFWVSMIVRVYAWLIILGNDGVIEKTLRLTGITDDIGSLLFNNRAMLVGMVYSYIPLMILPVFASIEKLDPALIEASHDLHASRAVTLRRVILPLCWPGLAAGAILVFVPSLGAVLEPILLGGGKIMMMGNLIQMQFGGARNWPFGAAVAIMLMCVVMAFLLFNGLRAMRKAVGEMA